MDTFTFLCVLLICFSILSISVYFIDRIRELEDKVNGVEAVGDNETPKLSDTVAIMRPYNNHIIAIQEDGEILVRKTVEECRK